MFPLLAVKRATAQQSFRLVNNWEFLKQDLGSVWEAVRPVKENNPESVPFWSKVTLPHCVNAVDAVDPDPNYYQGPSWYRTRLRIHNPYRQGRTLLHFEGAGQKTEVYIYTRKVGEHTGGYDEWTVDITDAIAEFVTSNVYSRQFNGEIPLSIRTDNSRDVQMIPSNLSDFNIYGGLYRYLNLVYVPDISIEKLLITPAIQKNGKEASFDIKAKLYSKLPVNNAEINVELLDPGGRSVYSKQLHVSNNKDEITLDPIIIKDPVLWSPDKPLLYTFKIYLRSGESSYSISRKIGVKYFEFATHGGFFLNGKKLQLRGTQRQEDHAGVGAALTEEMMRNEFPLVKEMGVNFMRLGHFQNSDIALQLCDSLGILVWEEIPWCRGGSGNDIYKEQARRMLANMIEQHYNHTSVIIWGLGNENDWPGDFEVFDTIAIRNFMKELNDRAHQLDPNRKTAIRRCDFCRDIVDVYSPTIWAGWYKGIYTDYRQLSEKEFQRVDHFFHAEWGGDSHARRYSEKTDSILINTHNDSLRYSKAARFSKEEGDWSETYICNLFDWHLREQETMPWLSGSAQWIFKDFCTPVRPGNPVPYVNQKGLVERDFTKKEGYYVFQSYWATKPMVHIFGHNMPVRWGSEGEIKWIKVYSNCDEAELFVNGASLGKRTRNSRDFPAAGLRWELPLLKGNYHVKVIAVKGKEKVADSLSFFYESAKWGKPVKAVITKLNDAGDTAVIEVKLYDSNNIQCLDARNQIHFALAGDGTLIEHQGTSTGASLMEMYNGRAIIKMIKGKDAGIISAKVTGVPLVFLTIE